MGAFNIHTAPEAALAAHIEGCPGLCRDIIAQRRQAPFVNSQDLQDAGYKVKRLATCMVTVSFDSVVRPVTCDAPYLNTGGQDRPLVIDTATGARSDGRGYRADPAPQTREVAQVQQAQQQQAGGYLEALARRNSQVRSILMDKDG